MYLFCVFICVICLLFNFLWGFHGSYFLVLTRQLLEFAAFILRPLSAPNAPMGITNLLQFLKPITFPGHVEDCRGQVVGVDAMCWMHRGAAACAVQLVEGRDTDMFLRFFISMVSLLRFYGVTPLIVFDGSRIEVKSGEDEKRQKRRETARQEALELLKRKQQNLPVDYKELMSKCSQSISITPAMVDKVIAACRELGIRCIVAPFEADAQLAYLSRTNQIHSAISEDSDLLAYGCKRVMLKMDKEGKCEVLRLPFLQDENDNCISELQAHLNKTAKQMELLRILKGLNHERFVAMCVLGGCDYTNKVHINGMGIGTACRLITQLRTLPRVLDFLCRDKKWSSRFPVDKEEVVAGHLAAESTFMNHKVFDPQTQRVVLIRSHATQGQSSDIDASCEEADERAIAIANGVLDPRTGAPRNTALSPAECALIRDFQEKAFWGLEAKQLRAEAASKIEETRKKMVGEVASKEMQETISSNAKGTETHKTERHTPKATGVTVRIATRAPAAVAAVSPAAAAPTQRDEANYQAVGPPADVVNAFDAFVAPGTVSRSRKEQETAAVVASHENLKTAKRLLHSMKDQGFKLSGVAGAFSAATMAAAPAAATSEAAPEAAATPQAREPRCGDITDSPNEAGGSTQQRQSSSSLLQFASTIKDLQAKVLLKGPPAVVGRREVVIKTRFAHRTKLISAAERSSPPFTSLNSAAATASTAAIPDTTEAAATTATAQPAAGAAAAEKGGTSETAAAEAAVEAPVDSVCLNNAVSDLPAVSRETGSWGVCTAEGPPLKRRSSAAFVKADDTEAITAFSSFVFVPGDKLLRPTIAKP